MATFLDGNVRRATANTVTAMKRSAERRKCPKCGRKSALVRVSEDWGRGSVCRWKAEGKCDYASWDDAFTQHGETLVPGLSVDRVDIAAGLAQAAQFGYGDAESQMVIEYALMRWRRGEEAGAERTVLSHGVDYTSWRGALAAAVASGSTSPSR